MFVNPLRPFLDQQGVFLLDGGLATHLETLGADLNHPLWSAKLLIEQPELIYQAHLDYYWAGADCATTASYQATIPGLMARGMTEQTAVQLIQQSVTIAQAARDQFWADYAAGAPPNGRLRPLVAASVGPYGAFLADGSEYSGAYGLSVNQLMTWHRPRWHLLAGSGADILAAETIPSAAEAVALANLCAETPETAVWVSFSCVDGQHLSDGTPVETAVAQVAEAAQVVAVGINCTPPRYVSELVRRIHAVTDKAVLAYPNSGEQYDVTEKSWQGERDPAAFGTLAREWRKLGTAVLGGCCRTTPAHIRQLRDRFPSQPRR